MGVTRNTAIIPSQLSSEATALTPSVDTECARRGSNPAASSSRKTSLIERDGVGERRPLPHAAGQVAGTRVWEGGFEFKASAFQRGRPLAHQGVGNSGMPGTRGAMTFSRTLRVEKAHRPGTSRPSGVRS